MTSATVTIGGTRPHDTNTHEKVMQVLSENENIETKEKTSSGHQKNLYRIWTLIF